MSKTMLTKEVMKEKILKNLDAMLDELYKHSADPGHVSCTIESVSHTEDLGKETQIVVQLEYSSDDNDTVTHLDRFEVHRYDADCTIDVMEDIDYIHTYLGSVAEVK